MAKRFTTLVVTPSLGAPCDSPSSSWPQGAPEAKGTRALANAGGTTLVRPPGRGCSTHPGLLSLSRLQSRLSRRQDLTSACGRRLAERESQRTAKEHADGHLRRMPAGVHPHPGASAHGSARPAEAFRPARRTRAGRRQKAGARLSHLSLPEVPIRVPVPAVAGKEFGENSNG